MLFCKVKAHQSTYLGQYGFFLLLAFLQPCYLAFELLKPKTGKQAECAESSILKRNLLKTDLKLNLKKLSFTIFK